MRMCLRCFCLTLFCCIVLGEEQCERFGVQCPGILQALEGLQSVNECRTAVWGANTLLLCSRSPSSEIAIRMSLLGGVGKERRQVVQVDDVLMSVQRGRQEKVLMGLIGLFLEGMSAVGDRGEKIRPLIPSSEYDGEAKWLDYFQWKPLVFPPAIPFATCKLCMNLSSPIPVYEQPGHKIGHLDRELVVGFSTMKQVKGSVQQMLPSLPRMTLLTLLVGYHCDLRRMIVSGHLHDAHSGSLLVISEGDADVSDDFRWHDFGDAFKSVSASPERLSDLRDHVQAFEKSIVFALEATSPFLASTLRKVSRRCFEEFTINQGFAAACLGRLAVEFATDVVKSHTLDTFDQRMFLQRVSRGFSEIEVNGLWLDYWSSGAAFVSLVCPRRIPLGNAHAPFELVHERLLQ